MSFSKSFSCHKISDGRAQGPALISTDDLCFYLVDPQTGTIIEDGHAAQGRSVAGKVLIFPSGKGSSVVQADGLYQLKMQGREPKAMIIRHPDTVLVATAHCYGNPPWWTDWMRNSTTWWPKGTLLKWMPIRAW